MKPLRASFALLFLALSLSGCFYGRYHRDHHDGFGPGPAGYGPGQGSGFGHPPPPGDGGGYHNGY
jgi:hypothetical protein